MPGALRPPRSKMRSTSRSARSGPGPSVSGSQPGRTRWIVCRPARRRLEVVGDRQVGASWSAQAVAARRISSSSGCVREQLEADQVDRGSPVADRADHLGRAAGSARSSESGSELILPGRRLGLEVGDGHRQDDDVDRVRLRGRRSRRRRVVGHGAGLERERASGDRARPASECAASAGGRARRRGRGIEVEPAIAQERKLRGRGVDVPDRACRSRQASVIAAAKRPEETLVMRRTSSIGAIVPPPVTTTFIAEIAPLLWSCETPRVTASLATSRLSNQVHRSRHRHAQRDKRP